MIEAFIEAVETRILVDYSKETRAISDEIASIGSIDMLCFTLFLLVILIVQSSLFSRFIF